MTLPILQISRIYVAFNLDNIADDLQICLKIINEESKKIPTYLIPYLVVAEDHRFFNHYGIDPISILRAIYSIMRKGKIQGASTIEQQFVRVITKRYERTLSRKIREQMLAIALARTADKESIARGYLAIAYYGFLYQGKDGIAKLVNNEELEFINPVSILGIVSRLKYPEPLQYSVEWNSKFVNRVNYVKSKLELANKQA